MLPTWFIVFSIAIRLFGSGQYIWGVIKGKAKPNPVTWFLWGLTAMIAFVAQLQEGVGIQALVTFILGIGPLVVCVIAVKKHGLQAHLTPFTIACAISAAVGIVLWCITKDAILAITFSIIADSFAGLPTLLKAYRDPSSEYGRPYLLSIASMVVLLFTITSWTYAASAFAIYMLVSNVFLFAFAVLPIRATLHTARRRLLGLPELN